MESFGLGSGLVVTPTVIVGIGATGARIVEEARARQGTLGGTQPWIAWLAGNTDTQTVNQAIDALARITLLEQVERLGLTIAGRAGGVGIRFRAIAVIDLTDAGVNTTVVADFLAILRARAYPFTALGILVGGRSSDAVKSAIAQLVGWSALISHPSEDERGLHPEAEAVAVLARLLLVLNSAGPEKLQDDVFRSKADGMVRWLRIGGSFVDGGVEGKLQQQVGSLLLSTFFNDDSIYTPADDWDPDKRTQCPELLESTNLLKRVLAATPFTLNARRAGEWTVALSPGTLAVELRGLVPREWAPALRALRDYLAAARASRWTDSVLAGVAEVLREFSTCGFSDLALLYRYSAGPRRIQNWVAATRTAVSDAVALSTPGSALSFELAVLNLHERAEKLSDAIAVWVRVFILTSFGVWIGWVGVSSWQGMLSGIITAAAVATIGLFFGLRLRWMEHQALMQARQTALTALSAHFEQQMVDNLRIVLSQLRGRITADIALLKSLADALRVRCLALAEELSKGRDSSLGADVISVEEALAPEATRAFLLDHLRVNLEDLVTRAASRGAFVPDLDNSEWITPQSKVETFAHEYLRARASDYRIASLLRFRETSSHSGKPFITSLRDRLRRRAVAVAPGYGGTVYWVGPDDARGVLLDADAVRDSVEQVTRLDMIGCIVVVPIEEARQW